MIFLGSFFEVSLMPPTQTVVHPVPVSAVAASIERRIEEHERHRREDRDRQKERAAFHAQSVAESKPWPWPVPGPANDAEREAYFDACISKETQHYARVRVVERPADESGKPFFLVYGDDPNEGPGGTGGFEDFQTAQAWFTNGGR